MPDCQVVRDRCQVIEEERPRETVVIRQQSGRHHQPWDKSLSFHVTKRLSNVPTDNHLKLPDGVTIPAGLSAPSFRRMWPGRHRAACDYGSKHASFSAAGALM